MASKRTSWTVDEMVKAVNVACERHDRYVVRIKYNL